MASESPFLRELLRASLLGPLLYLCGFIVLCILWVKIDRDIAISENLKLLGAAGMLAFAVGMFITHRNIRRILSERRERQSQRSASPWDPPA